MLDMGVKRTIKVPEGVEVEIEDGTVTISGPKGEISRRFDLIGITVEREGDEIIVKSESSKKRIRALVGTTIAHINNMIKGVTEGFVSKLKVVYSHFPISVSVRDDKFIIENFIGEEKPRVANIVGETEVEIKNDEIEVKGTDKEDVGQTAANIEQTARAKGRDPRIFQDGIYITERP